MRNGDRSRRSAPGRKLGSCAGNSIIEFILLALLLLTVLFTGIELDRLVFVYANLADAAKAGTRYAIVHGATRSGTAGSSVDAPSDSGNYSQIVSMVKTYATAIDQSQLNVTVTYPDGNRNTPGSHVNLLVQYTYDPWTGFRFFRG